jgi:hypothetical protein
MYKITKGSSNVSFDSITVSSNEDALIRTNDTERMRVTSNGNVGIGVTSPSTKLVVNGDVTITDKIIHSADADTSIRFPAVDTFTVETAGGERLRIVANGNAGIGTTSPSDRLHVIGSTRISGISIVEHAESDKWLLHVRDSADNSSTGGLRFSAENDRVSLSNQNVNSTWSVDNDNTLRAFTAFTERMRVTSAGNVGIGTTSPATALQVVGTVTATAFAGSLTGNANTATTLQTARTITLGGVLSGSASFDGSSNVTITAAHTSDPVITLAGDATGSATFTNLGDTTLTVAVVDDSHSHSFNNLLNKTSGTGAYSTTGSLTAGEGSGSVSLTVNDGYGNANLAFNHRNGIPDVNGSSARIQSSVDGTAGSLVFQVADSTTSGVAVSLPTQFQLTTSGAQMLVDLTIPDKIIHSGDTDTSIRFPAADTFTVETAGVERFRVTSTGNVGIGTASPSTALQVVGTVTATAFSGPLTGNATTATTLQTARTLTIGSTGKTFNGSANVSWSLSEIGVNNATLTLATSGIATGSQTWAANQGTAATFTVNVPATNLTATAGTTDGPVINSSTGTNVTIPTASATASGVVTTGDQTFAGAKTFIGSTVIDSDGILVGPNGSSTSASLRLRGTNTGFSSPAAGTIDVINLFSRSVRFDDSGNLLIGQVASIAPGVGNTTLGSAFADNGRTLAISRDEDIALHLNRNTSNGGVASFRRNGTAVGSISVTTTATAYNTSSDYRLKENFSSISDATNRLLQLPVYRFNFKADTNTIVDGFIAHEVQAIVPEAVTGIKDEVDANGNPVYQGIDQSKLVPLLVAALQDALIRIKTLEDRLT